MSVDQTDLAPGYAISRMIRGGWQLAGGHGPVDRERAIEDMFAFMDHGVTTFDCADIYTGVEDMYGDFRRRLADRRGEEAARAFKVHTKFVPDRDMLQRIDRQYVTGIIDRSLQRLATERLDLVQFHWWDYAVPGAIETGRMLVELWRAGKIALLAGTNFDTTHSRALLDAGVPIVSMQVQYSLLDARPENGLVGPLRRAWDAAALLRHARRRIPVGGMARQAGADGPHQPLAHQVQAHHRRFRRLGAVPGAARDRTDDRAQAWCIHCGDCDAVGARSNRGRSRDRRITLCASPQVRSRDVQGHAR